MPNLENIIGDSSIHLNWTHIIQLTECILFRMNQIQFTIYSAIIRYCRNKKKKNFKIRALITIYFI